MRVFKEFDEIKAAVGTEVGVSNWIEVTQERIEQFAQATGDNQWIHVDVERAVRELPTGTTIAHGLLTLSFAPVFIRDVMGLGGLKNTLNYGANRVRYLASVPAGSRAPGPHKHRGRRGRATQRLTGDLRRHDRDREPRASGLCGRGHCRALPMNRSCTISATKQAGFHRSLGFSRWVGVLSVYSAVLSAEKYSRGDWRHNWAFNMPFRMRRARCLHHATYNSLCLRRLAS